MNGPVITEKELFDSLDTEIDDISVAVKLFSSGKRDEAVKALADYVRKTYDRKSVFNALLIESENEPPLKERTEAEEALRLNLVSVGIYHQFEESVDWYKNPTENQYEEWTWQLSRHYQVVSLGRMYYYTKNEKYAECAVKLIDSWLDQAIRPEADVDGHATLCWRTIECGIKLQKWAQILALIIDSPAVSDEFLCKILRSVLEHYERLSTRYTDANWLLIEMEGLYITTLVFPFLKPSPICSALAKRILSEQIKKQTFLDGVQYELTMGYHSVCYDSFSNALRIGIAFNDRFPAEFSKMLISYLHTLIKVATPAENTPHVNDGMQVNLKDYIAKQIPLFPEDELLRKYVSGANIVNQNDSASWAFEFSGLVVFRENYSKDAVYGFFDGGKYGRCHNHEDLIRCHQHEDKLNFLMSIGEKDIVCEAGGYAYDVSKMRTYSRSTLGHNTAVIDGMDQTGSKASIGMNLCFRTKSLCALAWGAI